MTAENELEITAGWWCISCGSPRVGHVQPTSSSDGRYATGVCYDCATAFDKEGRARFGRRGLVNEFPGRKKYPMHKVSKRYEAKPDGMWE